MKQETESSDATAREFGLVGREECMAAVWPDKSKRPSERTFEKFKQLRIIPFVKIGKCVWYDPAAVLEALKSNHTVRPRYRSEG